MQGEELISRLSTSALAQMDREPVIREEIWRPVCYLDVQPTDPAAMTFDFNLLSFEGMHFQESRMSGALLERDKGLASRAQDKVAMVSYFDGPTSIRWRGREVCARPGDVLFLHTTELAKVQVPDSRFACVGVEYETLKPLLSGEPAGMTVVENSSVFRLLLCYLRGIMDGPDKFSAPDLQQLALRHIRELMAAVLAEASRSGTTHEHLDSGLRAARMRSIKSIIHSKLPERDLTLTAVAAQVGVTTRYVQQLFEREGTSFSRYVLEQRLAATYRALGRTGTPPPSVTQIALDAGFGDLSYFNRCFRRRYGCTPSEVRASTQCQWPIRKAT
ncbi:AraC family transcriptional regulator [Gilvimarinus sp. F26214L]|uniref:AraC family transcriptional regulator n=1 Tax=Gilvimarinus sp. DZF01 TaxID=3461371 RepID=UPI004045F4EF